MNIVGYPLLRKLDFQSQLTNRSLRERFGLSDSSISSISRLIKDAVEQKLIKPLDPNTAPRYMRYIPIWA
jgi:hypothetical protein